MPYVEGAQPETREFLQKIVEILMDYVNAQNDRNEKILEFHHPEEMKTLIDLDIPDQAVPLQQLVIDCATTLKYQVKTGKFIIKCSIDGISTQFPTGYLAICFQMKKREIQMIELLNKIPPQSRWHTNCVQEMYIW